MAPLTFPREVLANLPTLLPRDSTLVPRDPMTDPRIPFPMILLLVGVVVIGAACGLFNQFGCCEKDERGG